GAVAPAPFNTVGPTGALSPDPQLDAIIADRAMAETHSLLLIPTSLILTCDDAITKTCRSATTPCQAAAARTCSKTGLRNAERSTPPDIIFAVPPAATNFTSVTPMNARIDFKYGSTAAGVPGAYTPPLAIRTVAFLPFRSPCGPASLYVNVR